MKKILSLILIFILACSSTQTRNNTLPEPPNTSPVDSGTLPIIDQDAYNVHIESADVSIRLEIVDGAGPNGEILTPLRRGQPSPYNGVLFNGPAVARIQTEFHAQATQCLIDRQADVDRITAMARRDIDLLNVSLRSQRESYGLMLSSRDRDSNRLYTYIRQNNNSNSTDLWPYIGTGLGGLVLGAGIMTTILLLNR